MLKTGKGATAMIITTDFREISVNFMSHSADKLHGGADFIFQHVLASVHTAKKRTQSCTVTLVLLAWPEPKREPKGVKSAGRRETIDPTMSII